MRVITLAGSPRFPSRSSSLLEYAREKLNGLDVEVYHWNLQNFAPEDLLYARFDSPALKTFTEQLQQADGLIVATPVYKAAYSGALKTVLDLLRQYFPALTVVVIPELESDAENTVLMTAPVVMGQQTAVLACSEKLRTGRVVPDLSSVSQKWVSTTYGAIVKLPFAIAQMTGV